MLFHRKPAEKSRDADSSPSDFAQRARKFPRDGCTGGSQAALGCRQAAAQPVYLRKEFTLLPVLVITQGSDLSVTLGKRASNVFELLYVPPKLLITLGKRASNVFELLHVPPKLLITLGKRASNVFELLHVPPKLPITLGKRASNVFELPYVLSKLPVTLSSGFS
jgi:hypothetical protein